MRRLVELFLKMLNHEVTTATDGREATEIFQTQSFDVVFMDMRMPGMDGYEATRWIRNHEKEQGKSPMPVIALTAFSTQEEISKSMDAGCSSHLVKPVNKDALERALSDLGSGDAAAGAEQGASAGSSSGPIEVTIDEDLEDLIPSYLDKRQQDVEKIKAALEGGDFEELRSIGHKIKGSGGGYGFDGLSKIGAGIENAAKIEDRSGVESGVDQLKDYLERVEITYEEV